MPMLLLYVAKRNETHFQLWQSITNKYIYKYNIYIRNKIVILHLIYQNGSLNYNFIIPLKIIV